LPKALNILSNATQKIFEHFVEIKREEAFTKLDCTISITRKFNKT